MKQKATIFFYSRTKLLYLFVLNMALFTTTAILTYLIFPEYLPVTAIVAFICMLSAGISGFLLLFPRKLAIISDFGIKIDDCAVLDWQDISHAKEIITNPISKRKIIIFILKDGVSYPLNKMQHLCKKSKYSAFSIPLYAMEKEDYEKIKELISSYVKLEII